MTAADAQGCGPEMHVCQMKQHFAEFPKGFPLHDSVRVFMSCPNHAKRCAAAGQMVEALRKAVGDTHGMGNDVYAYLAARAALRAAGEL